MRILHILDHSIPLHSGYTFRTRAILEHQRAMGWETFHLTSSKQGISGTSKEQVDGLQFYRTLPASGVMSKLPVINQLCGIRQLEKRIAEVIPEVQPDLLHAHSPALNGIAALRAARNCDIPAVYEVRAFWEDAAADHGTSREGGLRYRLTRQLETYVLQRAAAVTTICEGLRGDIVQRGVPEDRVTVIPNAVDISRFSTEGKPSVLLQKKYGLEGKVVLGFIGSFYAYEGLSLLLQAMPGIVKSVPEACLLLVGGGPEESRLKEMIKDTGLQDRVIMTGRVPHDDVQDYYNLVDIFVYPRLSMRLTDLVTPLKPLEAMAQGRVVLASDVGGHHELIRPGDNGELFKAGSVTALQAKVIDMLQHRDNWQHLRVTGRQFVESERNWDASVARYNDVYAAALRSGC